jgi:ATPase subunit of ABC transporter with duplicated ATPase domains
MKGLSKAVNGKEILKETWLSFLPGAKIGIIGHNGAGKSTLLRIMAGLDKEYEGEAFVAEGIKIGYLPQEASIFRELSVEENIYAVLELRDISIQDKKNALFFPFVSISFYFL